MHANGTHPHILAVNDSADVLALFDDLLSDEGYRVSTMSVLTRDLAEIAALRPDLIILDYMWSTSDDSWSLLQMLRMDPRMRAIPIVLCTGAVRQVEPLTARLREMDVSVVPKPFDIDELLVVVADALRRTQSLRLVATAELPDSPEQHVG